jgi:hypothetical protein
LLDNSRACALASSLISQKLAEERKCLLKKEGFDFASINADFRLICALYWGEGYKSATDVRLTNCDSDMLSFFIKWLVNNNYDFSVCISFYEENGLSYQEIQQKWKTNLPFCSDDHFTKPTICKINRASQNKNVGKQVLGTATIRVKKSTNLYWKILGGIDRLRFEANPK